MVTAIVATTLTAVSIATSLATTSLSLRPWTGWSDKLWNFSHIAQHPKESMPVSVQEYYYGSWWMTPITSFILFCLLALHYDIIPAYGLVFHLIKSHVFPARLQKQAIPLPSRPSSPATCIHVSHDACDSQHNLIKSWVPPPPHGEATTPSSATAKVFVISLSGSDIESFIPLSPNSTRGLLAARQQKLPCTPSTSSSLCFSPVRRDTARRRTSSLVDEID